MPKKEKINAGKKENKFQPKLAPTFEIKNNLTWHKEIEAKKGIYLPKNEW